MYAVDRACFNASGSTFNSALYFAFKVNHEVKAFTFSRQYPGLLFPGSSQLVSENDQVDKIPAERILDTINPFTYYTAASNIARWKPDLLITKFWMPFFAPSLGCVFYRLKNKTKIISILDNVIPHERRIGDIALTKFFLNQNNGFVVMSDAVKRDLLQLKPNARYMFHAHPLYEHFGRRVDKREARIKLSIPADKKVILFFGFIRDYKGLDILIHAMKELSDEYFLCIAGEVYGSFSNYESMIRENNLNDKVQTNTRYINDSEVTGFFSAADVCVLPYKSATQSGITSIAYHFDLPVIATNVGGLSEYIIHNKTGLIVDQPNSGAIAASIRKYFSENLPAKFVSGIKEMKEKLSWRNLSDEIALFYKSL